VADGLEAAPPRRPVTLSSEEADADDHAVVVGLVGSDPGAGRVEGVRAVGVVGPSMGHTHQAPVGESRADRQAHGLVGAAVVEGADAAVGQPPHHDLAPVNHDPLRDAAEILGA